MVRVSVASHLTRHVRCPAQSADGATVREVLDQVFAALPDVREYVLDERGALRPNVVVFVDGCPILDRVGTSDLVAKDSELHVLHGARGAWRR